jgi:hypothetical protein
LKEKKGMIVYLGSVNSCVPSTVMVCWYVVVGGAVYSSLEVDASRSVFGVCVVGISTSG